MEISKNNSIEINPSILPTDAQRELYDFYQFLVSKYVSNKQPEKVDVSELIPRKVNTFVPLSRESIYE